MHQAPRPLMSIKWLSVGLLALILAGCFKIGDPIKGLSILAVISGNNQTVAVNTLATDSLTVRAYDDTSAPMAGVSVTWAIIGGSGALNTMSTTTDQTGTASVTFTAGGTAGIVSVTATAPAASLTVTFAELVQ